MIYFYRSWLPSVVSERLSADAIFQVKEKKAVDRIRFRWTAPIGTSLLYRPTYRHLQKSWTWLGIQYIKIDFLFVFNKLKII